MIPRHPLIKLLAADTLDNVRDTLAVVAAALACPSERVPERTGTGLALLLGAVDEALGHVAGQVHPRATAGDSRATEWRR